MSDERIAIPRSKNPSSLRWAVALLAAYTGIAIYFFLNSPESRPLVLISILVIIALPVLTFTHKKWIDPPSRTINQSILGLRWTTLHLGPDLQVLFIDNGAGGLLCSLGRFPRRIHVALLRLDVYDRTSVDPTFLRQFAEQISQHMPAKADMVDRLHRQADHIAAGGTPDTSPLAELVVKHNVYPLPGRSRRHE